MASFLPRNDGALLEWAQNCSTKVSASPVLYSLDAAYATAFAATVTGYASAFAANDKSTRSKTTVLNKNAKRLALRIAAGNLSKRVQSSPSVTDAQKADIGLNVKARPAPRPAPAVSPVVNIVSMNGHVAKVRITDPTNSKRRMVPGAIGIGVFSYVGPTPSANMADYTFEGNAGRSLVEVVFDAELAPGTKVWITAFYFNQRKQSGPACEPVGAQIQFGGMTMETASLKLAA